MRVSDSLTPKRVVGYVLIGCLVVSGAVWSKTWVAGTLGQSVPHWLPNAQWVYIASCLAMVLFGGIIFDIYSFTGRWCWNLAAVMLVSPAVMALPGPWPLHMAPLTAMLVAQAACVLPALILRPMGEHAAACCRLRREMRAELRRAMGPVLETLGAMGTLLGAGFIAVLGWVFVADMAKSSASYLPQMRMPSIKIALFMCLCLLPIWFVCSYLKTMCITGCRPKGMRDSAGFSFSLYFMPIMFWDCTYEPWFGTITSLIAWCTLGASIPISVLVVRRVVKRTKAIDFAAVQRRLLDLCKQYPDCAASAMMAPPHGIAKARSDGLWIESFLGEQVIAWERIKWIGLGEQKTPRYVKLDDGESVRFGRSLQVTEGVDSVYDEWLKHIPPRTNVFERSVSDPRFYRRRRLGRIVICFGMMTLFLVGVMIIQTDRPNPRSFLVVWLGLAEAAIVGIIAVWALLSRDIISVRLDGRRLVVRYDRGPDKVLDLAYLKPCRLAGAPGRAVSLKFRRGHIPGASTLSYWPLLRQRIIELSAGRYGHDLSLAPGMHRCKRRSRDTLYWRWLPAPAVSMFLPAWRPGNST